ncbi:MAG: DNA repair protein RecO [Mailhella sp.]|nr:DNA repair protein RecO [Mailhella sp.]
MQWTDDALVLRVGKFREADLWVRLLTSCHGMLTAFAFGGSRSRRRFTGCLDVFNRIRVSVASSRDGRFLNMHEATLLEGPERLRRDWKRQGVAANCIRFIEALGVPPDSSSVRCYGLVADMLRMLEQDVSPHASAAVLFRLRLASEQGYSPELYTCPRCGTDLSDAGQACFLVAEGAVCCAECRMREDMGVMLGREALDVLRKVKAKSPLAWKAEAISPEAGRQAARSIDAFVRYHLGLEWAGGQFKAM